VVTLALFVFLGSWNDFLWPLIILTDQSNYTLPVALAALSREHVQDVELMMASAVITVAPVLILFLALQRYYIRGMLAGQRERLSCFRSAQPGESWRPSVFGVMAAGPGSHPR
jgi:ABC-type glycerol-3-phosphate transport system permease component